MKNILLILTLSLAFFTSCKKGAFTDCFRSTGTIVKKERSIGNFNNILLKDNVNLILNKSGNNGITIEAGSNLIDGIITEVTENGVLELRNDNQCNWIRSYESPINVYLDYVDIDSIEYRSIGDISSADTLSTDTLWLKVSEGAGQINLSLNVERLYCVLSYGTANIVLDGKSGLSYVYSGSFGLIDMVNLESNFIYVKSQSSNDMYLRAKTCLGVIIENVGNIYYAGNPSTVTLDKTGPGELIKLPD